MILASNNEQLGVMRLSDALRKAQSYQLDLVEVAPNADPPVCRIVDFGKYRYQLAKAESDRKHTTAKLKEVKFRVNIDEHDYFTKIRHAEEFLDKGNKVKVQLQFRGREMAHKDLGFVLMTRITEDLNLIGQVEMEPRMAGRMIGMVISPLPANKRKRRWSKHGEILPPMQEEDFDDEAHEAEHHDDTVGTQEAMSGKNLGADDDRPN